MEAVVSYVRRRRKKSPRDILVVYLPEFVVKHWWQRILHRRTVRRLKQALLHEPGVMTATVPWAMHEDEVYDEIFDQRLQSEESTVEAEGPTEAVARRLLVSRWWPRADQSNRHAVYRGRLHEADATAQGRNSGQKRTERWVSAPTDVAQLAQVTPDRGWTLSFMPCSAGFAGASEPE